MTRLSRKRSLRILVLGSLGLAGAIGLGLALATPRYFSSPSSPRPWATAEFKRATADSRKEWPSQATSHLPTNVVSRKDLPNAVRFTHSLLNAVTTRATDSEAPETRGSWSYYAPQMVTPSEQLGIPLRSGSQAKLIAIASSYPVSATRREMELFDPVTLNSKPQEDFPKGFNSYERFGHFPDWKPKALHLFMLWDLEQVESSFTLEAWRTFDSRTHSRVSGGTKSESFPGGLTYGGVVNQWHDGPIHLVLDYLDGEWAEEEGSIEPDTTISVHSGAVEAKVIQVEEVPALIGKMGNNFRTSLGPGEEDTISFPIQKPQKTDSHTTLIFLSVLPSLEQRKFEYKVAQSDGTMLAPQVFKPRERLHILAVPAARSTLRSIHIFVSPPVQRVVYGFSRLPGTPPANNGVKNLFDIRIPYLDAAQYSARDIASTIESGTQLHYAVPVSPRARLMETYENISLRELMREQRRAEGRKIRMLVEPEKFVIYESPRPIALWWEKTRKSLPF